MVRIVVTGPADADAAKILDELAHEAGYRTAERYNPRFEALYDRLVAYPEHGAIRPKLGRDIRIGIVPPYIVVYRHAASQQTVSILRIVHGRRKVTRKTVQGET
jgi:toxin ParE1/3/4